MGPRFREDDGGVCVDALRNFLSVDSNSHAASFPRRRASWAFSLSPLFEGRWSAERRALVVKKRLSDAPSRDLWLRDRSSGDLAALRHDGFPPLPVPVQPAHSGRASYWARTSNPSASESALARHSRGRRIRPAWVTPPRSSFRSVPLQ